MKITRTYPLFVCNFLILCAFLSSLFILSCSSPPPLPQWEYTGGPYAQNISTVHADSHDPSTVYAGLTNGDLFVSTNQGNEWSKRATIIQGKSIYAIISNPERPSHLYAGTADGLFLSTDNGNHWKALIIEQGLSPSCRALAMDPFNTKIMYAGVDGRGIYTSTDGGQMWSPMSLGFSTEDLSQAEIFDVTINPSNPNILYAALSHLGVLTTGDGGKTWKPLTAQLAASGTIPTHLILHQRLQGHLCFGTAAGDVYKSTDGGANWSPTRQGDGTSGIGGFVASATNPNTVYAGTEMGLLVSSDFGTTWKDLAPDQPDVPCSITATTEKTQTLYVYGQGIGFRRSKNGGTTWVKCETGLGGSSVSLLRADRSNTNIYAVVGNALYSLRAGSTWISSSGGLHGGRIVSLTLDVDSNSTLYAGCTNGIYHSTNGGLGWHVLPKTFGPHPVEFFDTHPSIRTRMFTATSAGFFYSTDRGNTWNPTKPFGSAHDVRSITYAPDNAGILHAALRDKASIGSTDGGITWVSHRYGIKSEDVLAVTCSDRDTKVLYAWTANGDGFRSNNRGIEWDRYTPPWNIGVKLLLWVDKTHSSTVVALVDDKDIYYSGNGGGTWKPLKVAAMKHDVLSIFWSGAESALYTGTRDQGVFRIRVERVFSDGTDTE